MIWKILTRFVIPLIIVIGGIGGAAFVFMMAPEPAETEAVTTTPHVEVLEAQPATHRAIIEATGVAVAAVTATINPEISGRVISRNPSLVPGGRIKQGDVLVRIDSRDYRFALNQEKARLQAAELEAAVERGRGSVASREWELLGRGEGADSPLALRRPHLAAAKANVAGARSGVERAQLALSRTTLRAPWNAVVVEAQAEVGQLVGPTSKVVTLTGTDQIWIKVSVPLDRLPELDIPGVSSEIGSSAVVVHDLGSGRRVERQGKVVRLESRLDAQTRTAQLLVAVDDPLDEPAGAVPLLPGSFVRLELMGKSMPGIHLVPRGAVREGTHVWLVNGDNRLERRDVQVGWGTEDQLFLTGGLTAGDRIVTTRLATPLEGMEVQIRPSREPANNQAAAPAESGQGGSSGVSNDS